MSSSDATIHGARFHVAANAELGGALQAIHDNLASLNGDVMRQIDAVLHQLEPDYALAVVGLPHNSQPSNGIVTRTIGTGGVAILQKIQLVKTVPGAFPTGIVVRHDDIPGTFLLDSTQLSLDIGLQQVGERNVQLQNLDPAVDCAVWFVYRRMS